MFLLSNFYMAIHSSQKLLLLSVDDVDTPTRKWLRYSFPCTDVNQVRMMVLGVDAFYALCYIYLLDEKPQVPSPLRYQIALPIL